MLLDIHSHQLTDHPEHVLLNCGMQDCHTPEFQQARYLSVSLHPWYLTEENLPGQLEWMAEMLAADSRVIALGEAGLDKCCPVSYELQRTAFSGNRPTVRTISTAADSAHCKDFQRNHCLTA